MQQVSVLEDDLKKTYKSASSSIGMLIGIGENLRSPVTQERINDHYIPLVARALPGAHYIQASNCGGA